MKKYQVTLVCVLGVLFGVFVLPMAIRGFALKIGINNSPAFAAESVVENESTFGLPLKKGTVTAKFGNIKHPYTGKIYFHTGIDIAAPLGAKVLAPTEGTVVEIMNEFKEDEGPGKFIIIQHAKGYKTRYTHLQDIFVEQGQQISADQAIASVGNTGLSKGPHLHFEVLLNDEPMDPIDYIEIKKLKPLERQSKRM